MAEPYKGEDTQLAVGVESTQGSAVTPTRVFGKVAEEASPPDPSVDWRPTRVVGGDREVFQKEQGIREYQGGDVPVILYDGAPLAYLLGSDDVAVDSPSTGVDTHTIEAQTAGKPPSQTIEAVYYGRGSGDNLTRTFAGCVPNSGELAMNEDDELTLTLSYWAMGLDSVGTSSTGSISVQDYNPWLFADASSQLSLFGTSFARFESFSLSVENNLSEGRYIVDDASHPLGDARDAYELTYGPADVELSATIYVDDDSLYNELTTPTDGGFTATMSFERPDGDELTITARGCNVTEAPHSLPAEPSKIPVEVTMVPEEDQAGGNPALTITVEDSNSGGSAYV